MRRLFTLLCVASISIPCLAQYQVPPVNFPSPNAASLGIYGEVPVSLFTGLPQIGIPIYELKNGLIDVPISLSYHNAGFKPDVHPGWVGTNWALIAGGVITRKVNGRLEDEAFDLGNDQPLQVGYYATHSLLSVSNWNDKEYMKQMADNFEDVGADAFSFNFSNYSGTFYLNDQGNWVVQSNKKLKVVFDSNNFLDTPFPIPRFQTSIFGKMTWNFPKTFGGFTLITEDGTQYVFGGTTDAIEYSMDMFNQYEDRWKANSWYLTKVISNDGRQVTFTYSHDRNPTKDYESTFICSMYETLSFSASAVGTAKDNGSFLVPSLSMGCATYNFEIPPYGRYGGELISPVYLATIEDNFQKISFNRSFTTELKYDAHLFANYLQGHPDICQTKGNYFLPYLEPNLLSAQEICDNLGFQNYDALQAELDKLKWSKLDNIIVYDKILSTTVKQFNLNYNNGNQERLRLSSVQEISLDSSVPSPPRHSFTYYPINNTVYDPIFNPTSSGEPHYASSLTDHWGYFNSTNSFLPGGTSTSSVTGYYNTRNVNTTSVYPAQGLLKTITYPTGGTTEFQYEYHTYGLKVKKLRNVNNDPSSSLVSFSKEQTAGGVRIAKIKSYDLANPQIPTVEKNYIYKKGYTPSTDLKSLPSSGILASDAQYYWDIFQSSTTDPDVSYSADFFSTQSVIPMTQNAAGSHMGYSEVAEVLGDGSYTIHKFSNFDNGHLDDLFIITLQPTTTANGSYYEPVSAKDFERSRLTSKESYNSSGTIVSKNVFHYSALGSDLIRQLKVNGFRVCSNTDTRVYQGTAYQIYTYMYEMDREDSYTFDQSEPVNLNQLTSTSYSYNSNGLPIELVTTKGADNNVVRQFFYSPEIAATYADYCNSTYPCDSRYGPSCYDACLTRFPEDRTKYGNCIAQCSANLQTCKDQLNTCLTSPSSPYAKMQQANIISPIIESRTLTEVGGTKSITAGTVNSYKEFYPGKFFKDQQFNFESQVPIVSTSAVNTSFGSSLKLDPNYKLRLNYKSYDIIGNLREIEKNNGTSTTYLWGYNSNYPIAEIRNSDWQTVSSTLTNISSSESIVNALIDASDIETLMNQLRANLTSAQVTGYIYKPLFGIAQIIDINGQSKYFDFDKLGRMIQIRNHKKEIEKKFVYQYRSN